MKIQSTANGISMPSLDAPQSKSPSNMPSEASPRIAHAPDLQRGALPKAPFRDRDSRTVHHVSSPGLRLRAKLPVGGACASAPSDRSQRVGHAPFEQASALAQVGELRAACVVFSAAWLHSITNESMTDHGRMEHFTQVHTLEGISAQQQGYRQHELAIRGQGRPYSEWFAPAFQHYGVRLGADVVVDVMSHEEQAMQTLANMFAQANSSHVFVIMRTNGDNHAIATHQSGNHVHVFDPNHGEYRLRHSELKDGLRSIIQAYSSRFPVPELRVLPAYP